MNNNEKVFFVQEIAEGEFETESIWCTKVGEYYVLDNIPFVAKRVSLGDTVKVEYDQQDKVNYFDDFVAVSGNSTIRLYFTDTTLIEETRKTLNTYSCESEVFLQRKVVAVNIPKEVNYMAVKVILDAGESEGKWVYEESCLAHDY
jgi:Domain of unknown function (DUF4265)